MAEREHLGASMDESARATQRHPTETVARSAAWRPLRVPMFRNLLMADLVSDVGTFMQGVGAAFTLNAFSFLAVLWVIVRWRRSERRRDLPRETMTGAIREAFRYTRNTPNMTVLGRIAVIMFFASPFWALLPTVAHQLRQSASLYGFLFAVFGGGAILGALVLQRTQSFLSVDAMLAIGSTIFAT